MTKERIMIVEDEKIVALDIKDSLEHFGYSVPCMASSGEEAIRSVNECKPDLILMDIVLKGKIDGIDAARAIHKNCDIPVSISPHTQMKKHYKEQNSPNRLDIS
ncbi:response regulator [Methanolobus sp.]|uniref:response regulator n=1 Tax=Methanolobus sp. TaxID=1874737 RepID=UPI00345ACA19